MGRMWLDGCQWNPSETHLCYQHGHMGLQATVVRARPAVGRLGNSALHQPATSHRRGQTKRGDALPDLPLIKNPVTGTHQTAAKTSPTHGNFQSCPVTQPQTDDKGPRWSLHRCYKHTYYTTSQVLKASIEKI